MDTSIVNIPGSNTVVINGTTYDPEIWASCRYFSSVRTPRERSLKPKGWLFPKPYYLQVFKKERPSGRISSSIRNSWGSPPADWDTYSRSGDLASWIDAGADVKFCEITPAERDANIIKALVKLTSENVNFGVALAEAKQIADFTATTYGRIADSMSAMLKATSVKKMPWSARKRQFRKAGSKLGITKWRDVPKDWLQWQYAAKPLMSDVTGSLKQLATRDDLEEWVITVKNVTRYVDKTSEVTNLHPSLYGGAVWHTEYVRGVFTRLDYKPESPLLIHLNRAGLLNVPLIIYEKTWMSFVLDWAIPIGEWLQALHATIGFEFLSGSTTTFCRSRRTYEPAGLQPPIVSGAPVRYLACTFSGVQQALVMDRKVHYSSPVILKPRIKNPLSLLHVANGLSLISTIVSGASRGNLR